MTLPSDVPEPDALDQATPVVDEPDEPPVPLKRDSEVPEADALDQAREVFMEDDRDR
jgi:hypothetical protein